MSANENSYLDINGLQYFYSRIKHMLGGNYEYPTDEILNISAKNCTNDSIKITNGIQDVSGFNHHGTAYGNVTVLNGGNGFNFDLSDKQKIICNLNDNSNSFTYSVRYKRTGLQGDGEGNQMFAGLCNDSNVYKSSIYVVKSSLEIHVLMYQNSTANLSISGVDTTIEHQYTVTYDGETETLILYIDGKEAGKTNIPLQEFPITKATIGYAGDANKVQPVGEIKDFCVFSRALTATEVNTLYKLHFDKGGFLPLTGGALSGTIQAPVFQVNQTQNIFKTQDGYATIISNGNEMCVTGNATALYINDRTVTGKTMPTEFIIRGGTSTSWATINAGGYKISSKVSMQYNTTNDTLDFVFL